MYFFFIFLVYTHSFFCCPIPNELRTRPTTNHPRLGREIAPPTHSKQARTFTKKWRQHIQRSTHPASAGDKHRDHTNATTAGTTKHQKRRGESRSSNRPCRYIPRKGRGPGIRLHHGALHRHHVFGRRCNHRVNISPRQGRLKKKKVLGKLPAEW